jgi:endonuclease G
MRKLSISTRARIALQLGDILADREIQSEVLARLAPGRGVTSKGRGFEPGPLATRDAIANFDSSKPVPRFGEPEAIVIKIGRPVLFVQNNTFQPGGLPTDAESKIWGGRLNEARAFLEPRIPSVGRINVENHPELNWVGTGWLVAPDIVVSNAHVASQFATKSPEGEGYVFRHNFRRRAMSASIDFRMEYGNDSVNEFRLKEVLYIGPRDDFGNHDPDVALFRLGTAMSENATLGQPIPLSKNEPALNLRVAVIGYPAFDSRIPDADLMRSIFGDDYDLKRMAPGTIKRIDQEYSVLEHDASTLGGNSGSAILDLATGEAIGLHFAGSFLQANYAIPSTVVLGILQKCG